MGQYAKMFAACRIPQLNRDEIYQDPNPERVNYIVVLRGHDFYKVEVRTPDGKCTSNPSCPRS
jgi:hypothetical protein